MVKRGRLPEDFTEEDLLIRFIHSPERLTEYGRDLLCAQPRANANEVIAHKTNIPARSTPEQTLAKELGVTAWHELEAVWTLDGLRIKRKKGAGRHRMRSWKDLTLEESKKGQGLLLELAQNPAGGMVNPKTEAHRGLVNRVNKALKKRIGLKTNPIVNEGPRTRTVFSISYETLEGKDQKARQDLEDENTEQDPEVMEHFRESNRGRRWEDID